MQLFVSPTSPYARKARVVIREHGLEAEVEEIEASPLDDPPALRAANPLGKVPALVVGDGRVLADSKLITEYLDSLGSGRSLYPEGEARWDALRRAALAEGVMDAAIGTVFERRRPPEQQSPVWLDRWRRAIDGGLGAVSADGGERFDIGDIGLAVALDYLDFRLADLGWRERHGALADWLDAHRDRPSLAATRPA